MADWSWWRRRLSGRTEQGGKGVPMADIKTRKKKGRAIKTIDKTAIAAKRMKDGYAATK